MIVSTKGRYALRVMLHFALHGGEDYIPLKEIAERQEISKKYLEIIVKKMVEGGLIEGSSGKGGGYKLLRKPNKYTVGEILTLMEGTVSSVACLADKKYNCPRRKKCETLPMWKEFDSIVHNYLYGKKLSDLI